MSKWSLLSALRCELMMRSRPCFHVHQSSVLIESNVGTTTKAHELMWSAPKEQGCKKTTSRTLLQNAFRQPSGCQEVSSSCPDCHCPRSAVFLFPADVTPLTPDPCRQEKSSGETCAKWPSKSSATPTVTTMLSLLRTAMASVGITT